MKHLITFFIIGLLAVNISYSQAVDDRAVVPVSVTLNSILRLNIESGGNVEFNFNTLEQYENGIGGDYSEGPYSTKFTVASSVDWDLEMTAEDDGLVSTDTVGAVASMPLGYLSYQVEFTGDNNGEVSADISPTELSQTQEIITNTSGNAGDVDANAFRVDWACGTGDGIGSLMGSDLTGGRYSTNIFFILKPTTN